MEERKRKKMFQLNPLNEEFLKHLGFTFERYHDILEILFDFLDVSDVVSMAKVEPFLDEFVEEKYHQKILLPINEKQIEMMEKTKKKFALRLEATYSPMLFKNQLEVLNLRYLKEIKMVLQFGSFVAGFPVVKVYNEVYSKIFEEAPMLKKVEMSVNAESVDVIKKCPSEVQELTLNFGRMAQDNMDEEDKMVVLVLHTALRLAKLRKIKIYGMMASGRQKLKLHSTSLSSLKFEDTNCIVIEEIQLPHLTHLYLGDLPCTKSMEYIRGEEIYDKEFLGMVYEGCPKLEMLDVSTQFKELTLNFPQKIGAKEWIKMCKDSLRDRH